MAALERIIDLSGSLPGMRWLRRARYDRRFERNERDNLFRGVFDTSEAAVASAPKARPVGYDNTGAAELYGVRSRPGAHDYAAMFWLGRAIEEGCRSVFDVGGHVGLKFYAFREALRLPDDLHWTVCDVPAVVERGRRLAIEKGVTPQLAFTIEHDDLASADLLFASGALQYLPMTLPEWLQRLAARPRRIVINTTPLHPEREFFTLNSIGASFCSYRVFHEGRLVRDLGAIGYRVVDRWENLGKSLTIPFEAGYDVPAYRGMYLRSD